MRICIDFVSFLHPIFNSNLPCVLFIHFHFHLTFLLPFLPSSCPLISHISSFSPSLLPPVLPPPMFLSTLHPSDFFHPPLTSCLLLLLPLKRTGPSGGLLAKAGGKTPTTVSGDSGKAERNASSSTVAGRTQGNHQQ